MGRRLADFIVNKSEDALYEDDRSLVLTHYAMAERCMQVDYHQIASEILRGEVSDDLLYILEGGVTGYHDLEPSELIKAYEDFQEEWYRLYEQGLLPWDIFDEDPMVVLEEDETGEVALG